MQANANQEIVSGLEVGRGGMGVRGVVPVFFQGEHIGSVEIGANVDQILLDALKEDYNADWQIFLRRDLAELAVEGFVGTTPGPIPELAFQSGTLAAPLFGPTEAYSQALTGESAYTRRVLHEDANYGLLTIPLQDFSGQVVGVVDVLVDRSALAQAQLTRGLVFLASAVGALAITGFGLAWIIGRILSPVGRLTETAEAIAAGDRSRLVPVESNDELGTLAEAFNKMTNELNSLIDTLEDRITARTHDLALSGEVSRSLSTILDANQLAGQVVQQVQAAFNFYHVHIYLLDETQQKLIMVNGTGEAGQAMLAAGHSLMVGQGLVGRAAETQTAVLVPDVHQDSQWLPNPLLPETQAEVAVPIVLGEQVLGVLDVQHNIVNGLNAENVRLLQTIAAQVAIALQNARQVEQTRQSQERFALVITGTNDGIWDWDIRTNQVYFSPRWKEMIGYADDEISDDFAEFENRLHPEDHDFVMKQVDDYLHGRIPTFEFEFRMQHKDGSYRRILVRAASERDEQGAPLRLAGSHTDITERKEGEERIRRSEERFALAAAGTNDGVWDWDMRTNQVYFSPRWKEMIGYADDEISNDFAEFENRLHPDDHDFVMKQVDDYLNGRISTYEFEFRLQHKDGSYRWILVRAALVRDENGAPLRMAGSHTDITARKEAEEAIRNEQERTQAILESLNLPIVISRMTDGKVIYLNEPLADMIRQSRETLMGQATPELLPQSGRAAAIPYCFARTRKRLEVLKFS
jgi:PAS domain S-box-containing protein